MVGIRERKKSMKRYSPYKEMWRFLRNKIYLILLLSFLSIPCFSQEGKSLYFDSYRTIHTNFLIDLTQQDLILHEKQDEDVITVFAKKGEAHGGYFHFTLKKEISSTEVTLANTRPFTAFVTHVAQEISAKNADLQKEKIKKAVSFDNLIYAPVLIQYKDKEAIRYYKSQLDDQELVI